MKMLEFEIKRANLVGFPIPDKIICTVQEYKAMMGKWPKMIELYQKVMGKPLVQKHRALNDCEALHEILMKDKFFEKIQEVDNQVMIK